jgi:hypothetical protein
MAHAGACPVAVASRGGAEEAGDRGAPDDVQQGRFSREDLGRGREGTRAQWQ